MHNLKVNIARFRSILLDLLADKLNQHHNLRFYPHLPKASDLDILSLSLAAEALAITSQNLLYQKLACEHGELIACLPCRCNYNRRLRALEPFIDLAAVQAVAAIMESRHTFLADSMPLPICRNARIPRLKIMAERADLAPARGYSATDRSFLYGYKLHALTCSRGLIINYFITPANVHDVTCIKDLAQGHIPDSELLADKGYISRQGQLELFESDAVRLITPDRANAKAPQGLWTPARRSARKRIETLFSQLCDQFAIKHTYAKTCLGYLSRIRSKITALTLLQYLNFKNGRPIGKIKNALAF